LLSYDSAASSTLAWWPLAQPDKRADVPFDGAAAEWRPGTSEIWWVGGLTPAACRYPPCSGTLLDAFDVVSGGRTAEIRGSFGERILTFRPDGSAVMTGSTNSIVVVDI